MEINNGRDRKGDRELRRAFPHLNLNQEIEIQLEWNRKFWIFNGLMIDI